MLLRASHEIVSPVALLWDTKITRKSKKARLGKTRCTEGNQTEANRGRLGNRRAISKSGASCWVPIVSPFAAFKTQTQICQLREAKPGVSKPGGFTLFSGQVQIVSRTLSGLFFVGAVNRPRQRKRTNRENPRRVPGQIGKIPEKSGKSQKGQKRKDKSKSGNPPV